MLPLDFSPKTQFLGTPFHPSLASVGMNPSPRVDAFRHFEKGLLHLTLLLLILFRCYSVFKVLRHEQFLPKLRLVRFHSLRVVPRDGDQSPSQPPPGLRRRSGITIVLFLSTAFAVDICIRSHLIHISFAKTFSFWGPRKTRPWFCGVIDETRCA